jgi:Holliday junction resolvase RusA-like endonuclease
LNRPRLNIAKHVYQPLNNQQEVIAELKNYDPLKLDNPLIMDVVFYFSKKTGSDYPISPSIGDLDNHLKAIADNLVRTHIISDDRIIVEIHAIKCWAKEDYIEIRLYEAINDLQYANSY